MSDADTPDEQKPADELKQFSRDIDRALAYLVRLAEDGIEISVTLFIGAGQVSGNVIGGKKYFEILASGIRGAQFNSDNDELPGLIADNILKFQSIYDEVADFDYFDPTFIHLTNIRWSNAGRLAGGNGLVWRGKLASVDGFLLGQLTES